MFTEMMASGSGGGGGKLPSNTMILQYCRTDAINTKYPIANVSNVKTVQIAKRGGGNTTYYGRVGNDATTDTVIYSFSAAGNSGNVDVSGYDLVVVSTQLSGIETDITAIE
jgi:sugar/nucleoside kinase (ribokinase family)